VSDRALPPNPADWPDDPYELLGVERGASPRDLKRAYTALIRRYKPEQSPEEFRRVRAAYEQALHFADFMASLPFPVGPTPAADAPAATPATPGTPDTDEVWSWAVAGDEPRAYAALRDWLGRGDAPADVPLRLYWLLVLRPDLDPERPAAAWLVDALSRTNFSRPAVELYRRELDESPAALDAGKSLFDRPARPEALAELAALRLTAAVAHGRWDVIGDDLAALRDKVRPFDEPAWLRYCFWALDELLWQSGRPGVDAAVTELRGELDAAGGQSAKYGDAFDRLEFLLAMTANWPELRDDADVPAALRELLPRGWNRPYAAVRKSLVEVMERVTLAPAAWLAAFDRLWSASPQLVAHFAGLLGQYAERLEEAPRVPFAPETLAAMTGEFLDAAGPVSYGPMRPLVLRFCLENCVGPEVLAAVTPGRPATYPPGDVTMPQVLAGDWPMRVVCQASRLFWA
jgi:hypothetical protein